MAEKRPKYDVKPGKIARNEGLLRTAFTACGALSEDYLFVYQ
jgi:hypothetical protein